MIYTIFEHKPENFYPFSLNHAVFEIRSGAFSHLDRIQSSIGDKDKLILIVRDSIKDIISEPIKNSVIFNKSCFFTKSIKSHSAFPSSMKE